MRRTLSLSLSLLSFLTVTVPLSHAENHQTVVPQIIYTGDEVEIRSVFHAEGKIFGGDSDGKPSAALNLRTDCDFFTAHDDDFTVKSAVLEKTGTEYTLTLTIFPWKTGTLQFRPLNLPSLVSFSLGEDAQGAEPFLLALSPIEVRSIAAKTGDKTFLPPSPPLTIPGTTAMLVTLAAIIIVLLGAVIFALLHLPRISRMVRDFSYLLALKKNTRRTIRKLRRLQNDSPHLPNDKDFAEEMQHILRFFLTNRFGRDFSAVTTARIYPLITEICGGSLSGGHENVTESLVALFNRLDYIRFAQNATFLQKTAGGAEERLEAIQKSIQIVEDFDKDETAGQ